MSLVSQPDKGHGCAVEASGQLPGQDGGRAAKGSKGKRERSPVTL